MVAPNNASKLQVGFNWAFKGLNYAVLTLKKLHEKLN
jgi:hypothetical protein